MSIYLCWIFDCSHYCWTTSKKNIHWRVDGRKVWKRTWSCFQLKNFKRRISWLRFRKIHNWERIWNLDKIQRKSKSSFEFHGEHFINSLSFDYLWSFLSSDNSSYWRCLFPCKINLHCWISWRSQRKNARCSICFAYLIPLTILYYCEPSNVRLK